MAAGGGRSAARLHVDVGGQTYVVRVESVGSSGGRVALSWGDTSYEVDVVRVHSEGLSVIVPALSNASHAFSCHKTASGQLVIGLTGRQIRARVSDGRRRASGVARAGGGRTAVAPMPGRVVRIPVALGDVVAAGQAVVVVEAMKMENEVAAPSAGVVTDVRVMVGDSVEAGAVLVVVSEERADD